MQVVHIDYKQPISLPESACCIGFFDGFHLGHKALVQKAIEVAKDQGLRAGLITFDPDPWVIFKPDANLDHLTSLQDRIQLARTMGIEYFYVMHFTREFASLDPDAFHSVLHQMNVKHLICGFDYQYGKKNAGDVETLSRQSLFQVHVIDSVNDNSLKISSSRIEPLIRSGNVEEANRLLDTYYSIQGVIEHGFHRGNDLLQIPTANLSLQESYVLPGVGVYAGYMLYDGQLYQAMINVGKNPTFSNQMLTIEAHILDFSQDIYGKQVRYFFVSKIRDEIKFPGIEALRYQLLSDIETTRIELRRKDIHFCSINKNYGFV